MLPSLTTNNVSNCNEFLAVQRNSCNQYTLVNKTDNDITFSFTEQGGSFNVSGTILANGNTIITLPGDGVFEIKYSVFQLDDSIITYYDYIFENCKFIDCVDKLMVNYICKLPIEPCAVIEATACGETMSESQKQKQLDNLFQLYTFYLIKVFNFRLYWAGITNINPATERVSELTFLLKRIKAFVATCNIDCDEKCNECG